MESEPQRNKMAFLTWLNICQNQAIFQLFVVPSTSGKETSRFLCLIYKL